MYVSLLVTGCRHATGEEWLPTIRAILSQVFTGANLFKSVLIHGDCQGIDRLTAAEARRMGINAIPLPYISDLDVAGGPVRNGYMIDVLDRMQWTGHTAHVAAMHDTIGSSRGTKDCAKQAHGRGYQVPVFRSDGTHEIWGPK